ncbi:MAG: hypothetical protein ABJG33_00200 [Balneola sp.]
MTKVEELKENEPIKKPTSDDLLEVLNTHFDNLNLNVPEFRFVLDKTVSALLQAVREEEREKGINLLINAIKNEFSDENYDYLVFIKDRILTQPPELENLMMDNIEDLLID